LEKIPHCGSVPTNFSCFQPCKIRHNKLESKDKYITPKQYAEAAGLPVGKVTQMLRDGQLAGEKIGNRWRLPAGAVPETPQPPAAAMPSADKTPARRFPVPAFAEMTYLTEQGVKKWLGEGRLAGGRDAAGRWYVDAASLARPDVRRLLRNP
jgi:excisionase family DNA binding protein